MSLRQVEARTKEMDGAGVSDTHVCQIETGDRPRVTISSAVLRVLARLYGIELAEMVDRGGPDLGVQLSFGDVPSAEPFPWDFRVTRWRRPPRRRRGPVP